MCLFWLGKLSSARGWNSLVMVPSALISVAGLVVHAWIGRGKKKKKEGMAIYTCKYVCN